MVIDAIANHFSLSHSYKKQHRAEIFKIHWNSKFILLAKPQTFMNLSGESIHPLVHNYKIDLKNLLVVHDEVDIPFGLLKYQKNRGHGGHNGVRHIHHQLGTNNYSRLRIGVGRPHHKVQVSDFVLQNFSKDEQGQLPNLLTCAKDSILYFIDRGFCATANRYNQKGGH